MTYRIVIYFLVAFVLLSCKSEIEKIGIENVPAQRAYQNSILNKDSIPVNKLSRLKDMILDYKKYEQEYSSKYFLNYYLARAYNTINELPFYELFCDTVNHMVKNNLIYSNYIDSALYYSKKSFDLNPQHVNSFYILTNTLLSDYGAVAAFRKAKIPESDFPSIFIRDKKRADELVNYVLNNYSKIEAFDTSANKYFTRYIYEASAVFLINGNNIDDASILDVNNTNKVNAYYTLGIIYEYLSKYSTNVTGYEVVSFTKKNALSKIAQSQKVIEARVLYEQKMKNISQYGAQYIGTWRSDDMNSKLTIYNNGTYQVYSFQFGSSGRGNWDCTSNSISFTRTSGDHVGFMFQEVYHSNTAVFEYKNIFAPTLCIYGPDGSLDFCYSHFNE